MEGLQINLIDLAKNIIIRNGSGNMIQVESLSKNFKVIKRNKAWYKSLLHREYEIKEAVKEVSFSVNDGEIVGYLGPNGSGKSTTIKMLSGILAPTDGKIKVNGMDPLKDRKEYTKKIGVVFGQRTQLWWDIPVVESIKLMKYLYKIPESIYKRNLEMFYDVLKLNDFINIPVRQLSLGQRMRADLCVAFLHDPEVVYLDEPTIGLDAVAKKNIRDFIFSINREKKNTIILTTHDMKDIEKLCDRVIVIDHGRKMYDGNLEGIRRKYGFMEKLQLRLEDQNLELEFLKKLPGISKMFFQNGMIIVTYNRTITTPSEIIKRIMERYHVLDFQIHGTEIEEAIRRMYLEHEKEG